MSLYSYLQNFILFSPLLCLTVLILWVLDNAPKLRRGAGLENGEEPEPEASEEAVDLPPSEPELPLDPLPAEEAPEYPPDETISDDETILDETIPAEDDTDPGPAAGTHRTVNPRTRVVGAKKARSLARRDQRRAYHEFLHSQQAQRQSAEEALRAEEEERLFKEKQRRAFIEDEIAEKRKNERAARIERERIEEEERKRDVEMLVKIVGGGEKKWKVWDLMDALGGRRSEGWITEVLKVQGLLGVKNGWVGMVTGEGWYVRVGEKELRALWTELEKNGRMTWKEMGTLLEREIA